MHNLVEPIYQAAYEIIKNNMLTNHELSNLNYINLEKANNFINLNGNSKQKKEYYYLLVCATTYYHIPDSPNDIEIHEFFLSNYDKYNKLATEFKETNLQLFSPSTDSTQLWNDLLIYAVLPAACLVADIIEQTIKSNTIITNLSVLFIKTVNNLIALHGTNEEKEQYFNMLEGAEMSFQASFNRNKYQTLKLHYLKLCNISLNNFELTNEEEYTPANLRNSR